MTTEPLPPECAEVRRRLAGGDADRELLDHMATCQGCSAFAAALVELEARLAQLPLPEPPAEAAELAVTRFRAEIAAHGSPGTAHHAPSAASPLTPASPQLPVPPSPSAGTVRRGGGTRGNAPHARSAGDGGGLR